MKNNNLNLIWNILKVPEKFLAMYTVEPSKTAILLVHLFPKNLRPHRRNEPHQKVAPPQSYTPSADELEVRNPVIVSRQNVDIGEAGKSLCRLGAKFCPTPKSPIDEIKHYDNFVRWHENIRWKYHFAKDKDPTEPEAEFQKNNGIREYADKLQLHEIVQNWKS